MLQKEVLTIFVGTNEFVVYTETSGGLAKGSGIRAEEVAVLSVRKVWTSVILWDFTDGPPYFFSFCISKSLSIVLLRFLNSLQITFIFSMRFNATVVFFVFFIKYARHVSRKLLNT